MQSTQDNRSLTVAARCLLRHRPSPCPANPNCAEIMNGTRRCTGRLMPRRSPGFPGSQAPPGNPLRPRLCLATACGDSTICPARQSLESSAVPGRAWDRGKCAACVKCRRKKIRAKSQNTAHARESRQIGRMHAAWCRVWPSESDPARLAGSMRRSM